MPSSLLKPSEPDREPPANLADNLLRDFEERWWKLCKEVRRAPSTAALQACDLACVCQQRPRAAALVRQGDEAALRKLLASSGRVLAHVVDENRRRWGPAVRMNDLQPSVSRLWLFTGWQRNSLHTLGLAVDRARVQPSAHAPCAPAARCTMWRGPAMLHVPSCSARPART